jgi:hypothetical protein
MRSGPAENSPRISLLDQNANAFQVDAAIGDKTVSFHHLT